MSAADIPVMLAALTDLNVYKSAYNVSDNDLITISDVDHLAGVMNADIQAELDLVSSVLVAMPEPNAAIIATAGMAIILMLLISRRSRRTAQLAGFL